jgi:hypothetical protein
MNAVYCFDLNRGTDDLVGRVTRLLAVGYGAQIAVWTRHFSILHIFFYELRSKLL